MPSVRDTVGERRVRRHRPAVGLKIAELRREGYKPKVAVAAALNMERSGRLGPRGGYRRVGRTRRGPIGRQREGT